MKSSRIPLSLAQASIVAALVFALAWVRLPLSLDQLGATLRVFVLYAFWILLASGVVGGAVASLIEWLRLGSWWLYTLVASAIGALIPLLLMPRPTSPAADNPFALVFCPWTRAHPGIVDVPPVTFADYFGSAAFGGIVGSVLGASFWYFYTRGARPNKAMERAVNDKVPEANRERPAAHRHR